MFHVAPFGCVAPGCLPGGVTGPGGLTGPLVVSQVEGVWGCRDSIMRTTTGDNPHAIDGHTALRRKGVRRHRYTSDQAKCRSVSAFV